MDIDPVSGGEIEKIGARFFKLDTALVGKLEEIVKLIRVFERSQVGFGSWDTFSWLLLWDLLMEGPSSRKSHFTKARPCALSSAPRLEEVTILTLGLLPGTWESTCREILLSSSRICPVRDS